MRRLEICPRKEKVALINYSMRHPDKRPKGRKLKPLRASLYNKMDRRFNRLRTGLNEITLDVLRMRMPKIRYSVPDCPMMRYK